MTSIWRLAEIRWAALATALFAAGALTQLAGGPAWAWWSLYLACYLAGGWEPALAGLRALRDRCLDVDLLMVVAAIGAAAIGQVFDGALLIVIFATSGALEAFATRRTEDSVRSLLDLAPPRATLLTGDGGEQVVDTAELGVGDLVLVRPGERIGADGLVVGGQSEADQSTITGEPLPVAKAEGDEVFAGTLNGAGTLTVKVSRPAAETVVARIVAMVEEASATKAPTQLFVERIEQRYSVGVVVATLALFGIPLLLGADLQSALLRAMTFMIVASPCAVVLATMPPLLAAIANAGRRGVLVKSAVVLERLGTATTVAFDKTGTLTTGVPRLTGVYPGDGFGTQDLLALAAGAEHASEHPLGRAIVAAARADGVAVPRAGEFTALPGRGVRARVGEHLVEVGSATRLGGAEAAAGVESAGQTAVVVRVDGRLAGVLALADQARPDAAACVARLRSVTGRSPVLLTGDNARAAQRLASETGIRDVRAGLLPEDKVAAVRQLEAAGERVLVVGDGVNDAPALAAAHAGVAMGQAGADVTLETADAVIVRDRLAMVPEVLELSRRARRFVRANLVLAGTFIVVLVAWDILGHLPLPLGVAGHEGSTILVALNGLRLLRTKRRRNVDADDRSSAVPTRLPESARKRSSR
ncbi:heavy metal translocating P-type ATPase [Prauserella muralis]|uniref:heavy metal translocating P-type ATPase n=1 Tax=Prauserella muralis TaxID=588067 RepID=UPI0011ABCAE8|nr:heavy metal translocating P-type ATPase [Prauserella muralis]TWE14669.1 heavy metal-(Cd/Co/Hg/Pb/Zn)-translocating P-type ATPase [Prauserella muralis]